MRLKFVRNIALGMVIGLLHCFVPSANAQYNDPLSNLDLRLRLGIFFPTSNEVQDEDELWFNIGGDIHGPGFLGSKSQTFFSIDIANRTGGGETGTIVPIMLGQVFYPNLNDDEDASVFYVGAGIGLVVADIGGGPSRNAFGAKFLGGVELPSNVFIEASYLVTDKFDIEGGDTADASGFTLSVGYRF